jgi:ABC-type polysaccharide/polyol phosphate transport system ATPase subunit
MNHPAIRVHAVSKKYRRGQSVDCLRDLLASWFTRSRRHHASNHNDFWAIDDVSFDVAPGEAFGIIGPNGAGKSTMLKLLAGIIKPDRGTIRVAPPVSPLIELGAGFHGDLTGRENIYLNASILGMSRRDVRKKFDDIVDFADIGDFLETPVKRYSSGMHARLGFAIAAHVDPRVLLVDEVLSVGDRVFRAKCLDKMSQFCRDGVAVVFVSHDLGTVNRFCDRAMVLDHGRSIFMGDSSEAVGLYHDVCARSLVARTEEGSPHIRVANVQVTNPAGKTVSTVRPGESVHFSFDLEFLTQMERPSYGLSLIRSDDHITMFESSSTRLGYESDSVEAGAKRRVTYKLDLNVAPGQYALGFHVRERDSLKYAVEIAYAEYILVDADTPSGGLAHVNPRLSITELTPAAAHHEAITV